MASKITFVLSWIAMWTLGILNAAEGKGETAIILFMMALIVMLLYPEENKTNDY